MAGISFFLRRPSVHQKVQTAHSPPAITAPDVIQSRISVTTVIFTPHADIRPEPHGRERGLKFLQHHVLEACRDGFDQACVFPAVSSGGSDAVPCFWHGRRLWVDRISHSIFSCTRCCPLCLPEISSAACTLRIWRRPGSLRGHANRVFRAVHRARVGPAEPGGGSDRERRAAPSIGGLAATGSRATAVAASRPDVLDVALSPVARLAARARHRQARHGPPLASTRLSALLALEESAAWARAAPHPARRSSAYPPDVPSQSDLGRPAHPRRVAEARPHDR